MEVLQETKPYGTFIVIANSRGQAQKGLKDEKTKSSETIKKMEKDWQEEKKKLVKDWQEEKKKLKRAKDDLKQELEEGKKNMDREKEDLELKLKEEKKKIEREKEDLKLKLEEEKKKIEREKEDLKLKLEEEKKKSSNNSESMKEMEKSVDPNEPEPPQTAFCLFMEDFTKTYKENPENKKVSEVGEERWRSMSDEEKKPYLDKFAELKAEYDKALVDLEVNTTEDATDDVIQQQPEELCDDDA